jgi:mono/diheme cytochrome c family protein
MSTSRPPGLDRLRKASRQAAPRLLLVTLLLGATDACLAADEAAASAQAPPPPLPSDAAPAGDAAATAPATTPATEPSTSPAASPPDPQLVEKGRRTYRDFCQKCHGLNMVSAGGGFFDLRTFPPDQKSRFVISVTNGKRAMPAWGNVLKADEIESLWAYVSSAGAASR